MNDKRRVSKSENSDLMFNPQHRSSLIERGLNRLSVDIRPNRTRPELLWSFNGYGPGITPLEDLSSGVLSIVPDSIPLQLRDRRQWVCADLTRGSSRWRKPPISPITGGGFIDDPRSWGTFENALTFATRFGLPGVGFVLTSDDPFVVVDLDDCRQPETGELDSWAARIVETLDSYTEISITGTGLHIIAQGVAPSNNPYILQAQPEIYDHDQYIVCTGQHLPETPYVVWKRQRELNALAAESDIGPTRNNAEIRSASQHADHQALTHWAASPDTTIICTWGGRVDTLDSSTGIQLSSTFDNSVSASIHAVHDAQNESADVDCDSDRGIPAEPRSSTEIEFWTPNVEVRAQLQLVKISGLVLYVNWDDHLGSNESMEWFVSARDSTTGIERWRFEDSCWMNAITENQGTIYVECGHFDGSCIVALDAKTGVERWRSFDGRSLLSVIDDVIVTYDHCVHEHFTPSGEMVASGRVEGDVVALDARTGGKTWSARSRGVPIVRNGTAYIPNRGTVSAWDTRAGEERWRLQIHDRLADETANLDVTTIAAELAAAPQIQIVKNMLYASTGYTLHAFRMT